MPPLTMTPLTMTEEPLRIEVPGAGEVSALRTSPGGESARWLFIYAPGAGSNLRDPFGAFAATPLAEAGIAMIRMQFPYMEAGRRGPDRPKTLQATWRAVVEAVRDPRLRLVVGGRSMGGRVGSQVVAQEVDADALALFAYPLHAPGRTGTWRDEHFPAIGAPTLLCSGTRDAFASPEELTAAASKLERPTLHFLEGADHGFAVRKSSGRTQLEVWAEAARALVAFLAGLDD